VVLLHGQPGTGGDWDLVTPLVDQRHRVVAPDRPGYGRSSGSATGFAGNARAVVDLLDLLHVEQAVLVGHSWGGGVALATAIGHPNRVSGLVLVSSVGPGEHHGWGDRVLATPVLGEALAAATVGGVQLLVGWPRIQNLAARHLAGWPQQALANLARTPGGGARVWRSFFVEQRALLSELPPLAAEMGSISVPTAVVHGRSDHLVPPSVAEQLAAAIPGASLSLVTGAGHLLPHYRPEIVAHAIHAVADRVEGQTAR